MSMPASVLTPPLREGELLSREEFMRRWEAMPDLKFAELIDGIVHMPSPLSNTHGQFQLRLGKWLLDYEDATPGCSAGSSGTWLMSKDNVPQPDLALRILSEHGGQSLLEGEYPFGAPELIVEISHTTSLRDSGVKLRLYERSGVCEYLIVLTKKKQMIWRELIEGEYREMAVGPDGILRSRVFPGLWLDEAALWKRDIARMAEVAQQGLATPEHAEFAQKLASC
jgi:hypothetical protein